MKALTNEQLCALAKAGDGEAQNALVIQNMGFIHKTVNEFLDKRGGLYRELGVEMDELVSECCIGLIAAISRFDPERGFTFLTFAGKVMTHRMQDLVRKCRTTFEARIEKPNKYALRRVELDVTDFDGEAFIRAEVYCDPYAKLPEQIYIEAEKNREIHEAMDIVGARDKVGSREKKYLWYRFGFDEEDVEHALAQTAEHFYLSESRAKRIEKDALDDVWLELPWWYELRRDKARKAKERLRGTVDEG